MEWLSNNWLWVLIGLVLLYLVYRWGRSYGSSSPNTNTIRTSTPTRSMPSTSSSRPSKEQEMAVMGFLVSKLSEALEGVVDGTVGRHYDKQDRQKIAMGMIAVMAADKISLDRMSSDPALFATVMIKSIAMLTQRGEIMAH